VENENQDEETNISIWAAPEARVVSVGNTGFSVNMETKDSPHWFIHYMPESEVTMKDVTKRARFVNIFALGVEKFLMWVKTGKPEQLGWAIPGNLEVITNPRMANFIVKMFDDATPSWEQTTDGQTVTVKVNLQRVLENNAMMVKLERMGKRYLNMRM
jgi:hypothetical protein